MREQRRVLALLLLGAVLLFASSRLTWVHATVSDELRGTRVQDLTGAQWAAGLAPLALAALAAVAAVLAVRGWVLRIVALLVVVVGVAGGWPGVQLWTGSASSARAAQLLDTGSARVAVEAVRWAAAPAVLGAVALVVAGVSLLRAPVRARGLSRRYESPAVLREQAVRTAAEPDGELAQREIWDALDAGVDPTLDASTDAGTDAGPGAGAHPGGNAGHPPSTLPPRSAPLGEKGDRDRDVQR